ncbi:MAG: triose-phosphate isomerase [Nitrospinae bacterium]|nr:triose-phosphate isomerase [Nitrospinota bacterium]
MRKKLIAGNWKLNNNSLQTGDLIRKIIALTAGISGVDVVVAPVFPFLHAAREAIGSSGIELAAQDVFWEEKGAFTGEVAPSMLADIGCRWAIIGHSERRQYFGETDETVNKKTKAAIKAGVRPIVCVGETLAERESGATEKVIEKQLEGGFRDISEFPMTVIAYEPVWAIGTGKNATSQQAQDVHAFIRGWLKAKRGSDVADVVRILYGGSMKSSNAAELLACPDVDGGLIGGASLIAEDFSAIIRLSVGK